MEYQNVIVIQAWNLLNFNNESCNVYFHILSRIHAIASVVWNSKSRNDWKRRLISTGTWKVETKQHCSTNFVVDKILVKTRSRLEHDELSSSLSLSSMPLRLSSVSALTRWSIILFLRSYSIRILPRFVDVILEEASKSCKDTPHI